MDKNPENLTDQEKAEQGIEALKEFFDQFGPDDIYKQIFLEVLFEELLKKD